ncbi:carboxypeptidase-like regulatory domain-containing protein [Desulfofundulus sp.]|uniref:carboxypeptidase-like regulatory domain-containing protein n=1 Tax=Desulfofundulus sp. TaxID=2282750 RepID=UPI003C75EE75
MAFQLTSFNLVTRPGETQQHYDFFILPEPRVLVSGVVRRPDGTLVPGAVVVVFRVEGEKLGPVIGYTFTDQDGHFFLGPLAPGTEYRVKVFYMETCAVQDQAQVVESGIFPPVFPLPPIAPFPTIAPFPPISPLP